MITWRLVHTFNVRPGSIISSNCALAHASETKNVLMMEKSKISNHAMVADSILGVSARVGGHAETTNRRFDQQEIQFYFADGAKDTGMDKLGMILGEGARIGGGVFPAPGTTIGMNTFVEHGSIVNKHIPANMYVKPKFENDMRENVFSGELHSKATFLENSNRAEEIE